MIRKQFCVNFVLCVQRSLLYLLYQHAMVEWWFIPESLLALRNNLVIVRFQDIVFGRWPVPAVVALLHRYTLAVL